LFALCEAEAIRSTRSDRDQRLHNLKTATLLVGPWIEKRHQAFQSPRHENQRSAEVGFDHDERRKQPRHHAARNKRAPEVSFFTRALLEEVREKNDEREF